VRRDGEGIQSYSNTESTREEKVFEKTWIYRSGISGSGVRERVDLVFEVERILQKAGEPDRAGFKDTSQYGH